MTRRTAQERFDEKWEIDVEPEEFPGNGPCHRWTACIDKQTGYGRFSSGTPDQWAHRFAWTSTHGPIPKGLRIDHRCRNHWCVNVAHLRLVTAKQNGEHMSPRATPRTQAIQSKYRGVSWDKAMRKWRAYASHNGVQHYAGFFVDEDEAGEAARQLRNRLFTHNDLDR